MFPFMLISEATWSAAVALSAMAEAKSSVALTWSAAVAASLMVTARSAVVATVSYADTCSSM